MITIICGVDVSKARLDVCVMPGQIEGAFANDAPGIAELAAFCQHHGVELVVMEASGGYERQPYLLLWQAGLACALAHARGVRLYAKAMGTFEKTDRIDAAIIARFALAKQLKPDPVPNPAQQRLTALVARLSQVVGDLTIHKQRRATTTQHEARASLEAAIAFAAAQARELETTIAQLIDADPLWACLNQAFRSVKGVAGRTVARLMAQMPQIGTYSNKAIAKLAGLAPLADDSGKRQGARHIRGGRAGVRSILYLVADLARRFDKHLADFHQRLTKAGKPKMVVRIALARKLLVILNAKARDARKTFAAQS